MKRRRYLRGLAAISPVVGAGCSAPSICPQTGDVDGNGNRNGYGDGAGNDPSATDTSRSTQSSTPTTSHADREQVTVDGVSLPIPEDDFVLGAFKDAIPAITEPRFAPDWRSIEIPIERKYISPNSQFDRSPRLDDDDLVIGFERGGIARSYPISVINWHEVVNDVLPTDGGGREPLLITYCPLCRSGLVASGTFDGETRTFGVSGLLYESNLVMYDTETRSLWSQRLGAAVRGPRTGTHLSIVPFSTTTWGKWRDAYPDGEVLLPPPRSGTIREAMARDTRVDPYQSYEDSARPGLGYNEVTDDRLHPKVLVLGITDEATATAYPLPVVTDAGFINDRVGDRPVVVAAGPGGSSPGTTAGLTVDPSRSTGRMTGTSVPRAPAGGSPRELQSMGHTRALAWDERRNADRCSGSPGSTSTQIPRCTVSLRETNVSDR